MLYVIECTRCGNRKEYLSEKVLVAHQETEVRCERCKQIMRRCDIQENAPARLPKHWGGMPFEDMPEQGRLV